MINVRSLSKEFTDVIPRFKVIDNISLDIKENEFVTIFGPNGCGKSVFLKILAGLDEETSGMHPEFDKVGFVFQDFKNSLLPWLTVEENIAFTGNNPSSIIQNFNLESHKDKFPYQLSGGLAQLVSIGRAISGNPNLLVLDEPFSALDFQTAMNLKMKFLRYWEKNRITTFLVTHCPDEAILLSDRVIVFSELPAKIVDIIEVDLPRPRTVEMLTSPEFLALKTKLINAFRGFLQ